MAVLNPIQWAVRPLKNYADFSGRASRAEFWWFFLFLMIIYFAVAIAAVAVAGASSTAATGSSAGMIGAFGAAGIFIVIFWLVLLVPVLAVQTRRLHDTNRSGWWLLAYYLIYVAYMVMVGLPAMAGNASQDIGAGFAAAAFVAVVFFLYTIVLLVFYCLRGTDGSNRFGDDPYGPDVEEVFA